MLPAQERRFLRAVLKRLDSPESSVRAIRRRLLVAWLALVVIYTAAGALGRILPLPVTQLLFFAVGAATVSGYHYIIAARGWGMIKSYLRREAVEDRLRELAS